MTKYIICWLLCCIKSITALKLIGSGGSPFVLTVKLLHFASKWLIIGVTILCWWLTLGKRLYMVWSTLVTHVDTMTKIKSVWDPWAYLKRTIFTCVFFCNDAKEFGAFGCIQSGKHSPIWIFSIWDAADRLLVFVAIQLEVQMYSHLLS